MKKLINMRALNWTQFLGAFNDNLFRWIATFMAIDLWGVENEGKILSSAGVLFVLPFLFFSDSGGVIADRTSKSTIIVKAKFAEVVIMIIGWGGFIISSPQLVFLALFCMAAQSAFFGPAKYGIIPELVTDEELSQANSSISSMTFAAIICGTAVASFLAKITDGAYGVISTLCVIVALGGYLCSLTIPKTPIVGERRKISPLFFLSSWQTLRSTMKKRYLYAAIISSSIFWMLATFINLQLIPFGREVLGVDKETAGMLFLLVSFGIGGGFFIAGRISGEKIKLGLVAIGVVGLYLSVVFLSKCTVVWVSCIALVMIGIFSGILSLPLNTYIQWKSPELSRGRILASCNFFNFIGIMSSSILLYIFEYLEVTPASSYRILGSIIFIAALIMFIRFPEFYRTARMERYKSSKKD